jgi:hypothetical protein
MTELPADRREAQRTRDQALRRIARTRFGVIAGSAGLTAGLVVVVADTAPGKTHHASAARPVASVTALPPLETPGQLGLRTHHQQPATQPAATGTQPAVTATQPAVTATQPAVTATQPAVTATQPAVTATQPAVTATQPQVTAPPVQAAPAPVVSGGS